MLLVNIKALLVLLEKCTFKFIFKFQLKFKIHKIKNIKQIDLACINSCIYFICVNKIKTINITKL